jgi:hypothetical protein
MDTQVIEIIGRNRLIDELLAAGLEVAVPARDRGIDLIAYIDLVQPLADGSSKSDRPPPFSAKPIQMKAASVASFSISKKYQKVCDLLFAFVWHLKDPRQAVTYAMTHDQAVRIAEAIGWTATSSWIDGGIYSTTKPSKKVVEALGQYRMSPERWWNLVAGAPGGGGR